jgi:succinate dehydrogenase / fumarate reductase flavoprotein subunit
VTTEHAEFKACLSEHDERINHMVAIQGDRSVDSFHRELGLLMWDKCGMERTPEGLREALEKIPSIRGEFRKNLRITGRGTGLNMELEKAGRVSDFLEFAEVMCHDALERNESCGGHFRSDHQYTEDDEEVKSGNLSPGEAKRDDANYSHVAAWEFTGVGNKPNLHKEPLVWEEVHPSVRSYK